MGKIKIEYTHMSFWVHSDNEHTNSNWDKRKEIRKWEQTKREEGRREGGGKGIGRKQREREERREKWRKGKKEEE